MQTDRLVDRENSTPTTQQIRQNRHTILAHVRLRLHCQPRKRTQNVDVGGMGRGKTAIIGTSVGTGVDVEGCRGAFEVVRGSDGGVGVV